VAIKYIKIFQTKALIDLPKLGFFGLNIEHLATLAENVNKISGAADSLLKLLL
jgi:hypothetical protein